jgi:hypothetical protein
LISTYTVENPSRITIGDKKILTYQGLNVYEVPNQEALNELKRK